MKPTVDDAPLVVRVECTTTGDADDVCRRCEAAIRDQLGLVAAVELLARDTLPRSGYKTSRVVDA